MKSLNHVDVFALAAVLLTVTGLIAEEPQKKERFVPNNIAIDDVTLSSPNGKARGSLKKGTKVAGNFNGRNVLNVKTKDGEFGLAYSNFFSRLGSNIKITKDAKQVAESSNQFAFDLYRQARQKTAICSFHRPASQRRWR